MQGFGTTRDSHGLKKAKTKTDKAYSDYQGGTHAPVAACFQYIELVDERIAELTEPTDPQYGQ